MASPTGPQHLLTLMSGTVFMTLKSRAADMQVVQVTPNQNDLGCAFTQQQVDPKILVQGIECTVKRRVGLW